MIQLVKNSRSVVSILCQGAGGRSAAQPFELMAIRPGAGLGLQAPGKQRYARLAEKLEVARKR